MGGKGIGEVKMRWRGERETQKRISTYKCLVFPAFLLPKNGGFMCVPVYSHYFSVTGVCASRIYYGLYTVTKISDWGRSENDSEHLFIKYDWHTSHLKKFSKKFFELFQMTCASQ